MTTPELRQLDDEMQALATHIETIKQSIVLAAPDDRGAFRHDLDEARARYLALNIRSKHIQATLPRTDTSPQHLRVPFLRSI